MHSRYAIHFHSAMNVKMIITKYKTNNIVGCSKEGVHCRSMFTVCQCTLYICTCSDISCDLIKLHRCFRCECNAFSVLMNIWWNEFDQSQMVEGNGPITNGNNADYNFQWWINEQSFIQYGIRQKYFNLQLKFRKWETKTKWNNKIK